MVDQLPKELSDEEVAKRVQGGEIEIFGVLVERYEQKLKRYGRKYLARQEDVQDIVQDIFLSTYQNIKGFNTNQRFSPWIYRIAHNAFVNALRKNERSYVLTNFDTIISGLAYNDPSESEREQIEIRKLIDEGLANLPPKYREVLVLHYLEELGYKDIADILQIPLGTVGVRLKRAKEQLKANLAKHKL